MPTHTTHTTNLTPRTAGRARALSRALARTGALTTLFALALCASAHAGTYVIDNCPSAPAANSNAGAWSIFGSPQADQATCSPATGGYIGPLGGYMAPDTSAGVSINVPGASSITIRQASIWWTVPGDSGATSFADASTNAGVVAQSATPLNDASTPERLQLPSTTTSLTLMDYCSSDEGSTGCTFDNPILELLGAQLTLEDPNLPSGNVTGGALAGTGTLTGTQALAYSASDDNSGVRLVKLLIDGNQVAENDYIERCPYENFLACPASISDTISWNTATVTDGSHQLEAVVQDAAQNTSVFHTATITTNNAPTNTTAPTINTPSQAAVGAPLTAQPGGWSAPNGAGAILYSYQWQDCNSEGNDCQSIPGAQTPGYTPTTSDTGHTLRVLVDAADNDGASSAASEVTSIVPTPPGSPTGPGTGGSTPGPSTGPGAANGTPASETADLQLATPARLSRSFAQRAFKLTGRLTNSQAQPITGASLEILAQTEGASSLTLIAHTTTSPTGAFTANIPAGPSRIIEVAYRAYPNDSTYTAIARIQETVAADAQLHINQTRTSPEGTIEITGKVQGPIPRQGTIVELLVDYRGYWEPIRTPRTKRNGSFTLNYKFQDAVGRFPFRLEIPAGQAGFPYTRGYSNTVNVNTA
jgi:hypothetical protein